MDETVASDSDGEGSGTHHHAGGQVTAKLQRLNEEETPASGVSGGGGEKSASSASSGGSSEATAVACVIKEPSHEDVESSLKDASGAPCSDLIVLGLPYKLDDAAFQQYFEQFGEVDMCEVRATRVVASTSALEVVESASGGVQRLDGTQWRSERLVAG